MIPLQEMDITVPAAVHIVLAADITVPAAVHIVLAADITIPAAVHIVPDIIGMMTVEAAAQDVPDAAEPEHARTAAEPESGKSRRKVLILDREALRIQLLNPVIPAAAPENVSGVKEMAFSAIDVNNTSTHTSCFFSLIKSFHRKGGVAE